MARKNNRPHLPDAYNASNAIDASSRIRIGTAFEAGTRLSAGDNGEYKLRAEQSGSGMVDKMAEDYEIKAESSGFASDNNKYSN